MTRKQPLVISGVVLALGLCGIGVGQEIGFVDLTHPSSPAFPYGCKRLIGLGAIGDGWATGPDGVPLKIVVQLDQLNDTALVAGAEITARVRLQNSDTRPITIPWRTEFKTALGGQPVSAERWEEGTFEFGMRDQHGHQSALKSLTGSVYGSEPSAGSERILDPGESFSSLVKFKLESEFGSPVTVGEWQLRAKWMQTGISRSVRKQDCAAAYFYSHYERFYQQEALSKTIQVVDPAAGPATPNNQISP